MSSRAVDRAVQGRRSRRLHCPVPSASPQYGAAGLQGLAEEDAALGLAFDVEDAVEAGGEGLQGLGVGMMQMIRASIPCSELANSFPPVVPGQITISTRLHPFRLARHLRGAEHLNAMLTGGHAGEPSRYAGGCQANFRPFPVRRASTLAFSRRRSGLAGCFLGELHAGRMAVHQHKAQHQPRVRQGEIINGSFGNP
jgi:hypothetical protein